MLVNVETLPRTNLSFTDITLSVFNVTLSGGLCNYQLGSVVPSFEVPSCNYRRFHVIDQMFGSSTTSYHLPALPLFFSPVPRLFEDQPNSLSPAEVDSVEQFLANNNRLSVDLSTSNVTIDLVYHSEASVQISSPAAFVAAHCSDGNMNKFSILPQNSKLDITFSVTESYGSRVCYHLDPSVTRVWVRDMITADSTLPCYSGCAVDIVYDGTQSLAHHVTRVGAPYFFERTNFANYTRDLYYGIFQSSNQDQYHMSILSTGSYSFAGEESLKLATSSMMPLYILRRPPGGSSGSEFSGTFTVSTAVSIDVSTGLSSSFDYSVDIGGSVAATLLTAPMGMGTSQPLFSASAGVGVLGFVPVLQPNPDATSIKHRMVVPQFNPTIYSDTLEPALQQLYNPNNIKSPFLRDQDCSVTSGVEDFAKAALNNLEVVAEFVMDDVVPLLEAAAPPSQSLSPMRRTLKSGSFECDSGTELDVSIGQSHSQTLSVSTPEDPAIIDGDGDMFLFMVQDILLSFTNVLTALPASSSSTMPTVYLNGNANSRPINPSSTQCQVVNPYQRSTASSSGNSQLFWVSQWTIKNELIPYSDKVAADVNATLASGVFDDTTERLYKAVVNNSQNWRDILTYSQSLKDNALQWPELLQQININEKASSSPTGLLRDDYSTPMYLDGGDLVVSFYGGMGGITFSIDTESDQSVSNSKSTDRTGSSDLSVSLGLKAAGFGLDVAVGMDYSNTQGVSGSAESDVSSSRSMSFALGDPDLGDAFNVIIRRDPVYGSPVFITRSGRSRCRWEANTVAREELSTSWDPILVGPLSAGITLYTTLIITRMVAETATAKYDKFSYYLNLDQQTNTQGLIVTAIGIPMLQDAVKITMDENIVRVRIGLQIPPGSTQRGSTTLTFRLTGICYEDIVTPREYAYEPKQPSLQLSTV